MSFIERHQIRDAQVASDAAIARSKLAQDAAKVYVVPLTEMRIWDAVHTLPPAATPGGADDMGLVTGTFGTDVPTLQSNNFQGDGPGASTDVKCRFFFALPTEYEDGETVTVRIYGHMITTVADGHCRVDVECFKSNKLGAVDGADLCSDVAQSINSLNPDPDYVDFTITPGGLVAGDLLDIRLAFEGFDQNTITAVIAEISQVELLLDIKG